MPVLHVTKELHVCPKKLLEQEGYLKSSNLYRFVAEGI